MLLFLFGCVYEYILVTKYNCLLVRVKIKGFGGLYPNGTVPILYLLHDISNKNPNYVILGKNLKLSFI